MKLLVKFIWIFEITSSDRAYLYHSNQSRQSSHISSAIRKKKKQRLLSPYSRAHHPSPLHPSFFPRDAERIDLDSDDCGAYLGRCSLKGEGKNPIRSRETRNLNFERSQGVAGGRKTRGWDAPRGFLFPSLRNRRETHHFGSPLPSSSSFSSFGRGGRGGGAGEKDVAL